MTSLLGFVLSSVTRLVAEKSSLEKKCQRGAPARFGPLTEETLLGKNCSPRHLDRVSLAFSPRKRRTILWKEKTIRYGRRFLLTLHIASTRQIWDQIISALWYTGWSAENRQASAKLTISPSNTFNWKWENQILASETFYNCWKICFPKKRFCMEIIGISSISS